MSILNVNKINPVGGGSTITIAGIASVTNNVSVGNSVTASSFHGNLTGDVTGNVTGNVTGTSSGLSGNPSINTTGIITATNVSVGSSVTATNFFGSGAGLTNISGGKVLQVQSTLKTDTTSYTLSAGTLSAIIFSVNITPASASNKIIIHAHLTVGMESSGENAFGMVLTKDGSPYNTLMGDAAGSSTRVLAMGSLHSHTYYADTISATAVDTAGGTSAITYGIALTLRDNGSTTGQVNRVSSGDTNAWTYRATSGITVMEVEA